MRFSSTSDGSGYPTMVGLKVDHDDGDSESVRLYRAESLSSQYGRGKLIRETYKLAIKQSDPVKLSWSNLNYTVMVPTTKEEQK